MCLKDRSTGGKEDHRERERGRNGERKRIFYLLIDSSDGSNSWDWVILKSRARNSSWVSPMGSRD